MESLDFNRFALQMYKYGPQLKLSGLEFRLEEGSNLFQDQIILSFSEFLKTYYFSTTANLWDQTRQFSIWSSHTGKYHYRINPINWEPLRINVNNANNTVNFNLMTPSDLPSDLNNFGLAIMQLIHQMAHRINQDRLAYYVQN